MNSSYFEQNERKDLQFLRHFNDRKGWFKLIAPTEKYSRTDAYAYDRKERVWDIELKGRNVSFDRMTKFLKTEKGTIITGFFIKKHKLDEMIARKLPASPSVYWNFFENGKRCWFILSEDIQRLVDDGTIQPRHTPVYSKGYERKETDIIYDIPFKYGRFYSYKEEDDMWYEGLL